MDLSIVIPAYNEQANLEPLLEELQASLKDIPLSYDIWIVNDGSRDGSAFILNKLRKKIKNLGVIHLPANAGHQAALLYGIKKSQGEIVITLDADFQHPPSLIPELITTWMQHGVEVVQTQRNIDSQKYDKKFKNLLSKYFYEVCNFIFKSNLTIGGADFRLMGKELTKDLRNDHRPEIFLRGFIAQSKYSRKIVNFDVQKRRSGESKYSFKKQFELAILGVEEVLRHSNEISTLQKFLINLAVSWIPGKSKKYNISASLEHATLLQPRIALESTSVVESTKIA